MALLVQEFHQHQVHLYCLEALQARKHQDHPVHHDRLLVLGYRVHLVLPKTHVSVRIVWSTFIEKLTVKPGAPVFPSLPTDPRNDSRKFSLFLSISRMVVALQEHSPLSPLGLCGLSVILSICIDPGKPGIPGGPGGPRILSPLCP